MISDTWKILEHTNDWLRFADTKAAGALAASGVIGGLAMNALLDDTTHLPTAAVWFVISGLVGLLVAAGLAVSVLVPRLNVGEPTSLIYYAHVAQRYKKDADAHHQALQALLADEGALTKELANQVWANATVARRKYLFSSWSFLALAIALLLLSAGTIIAALP